MDIRINAKKFDLTDALKEHINQRITRIEKLKHPFHFIEFILSVEKYRNQVKLILKAKDTEIRCETTDNKSMYQAINAAIEKASKQFLENKEKNQPQKIDVDKMREQLLSPQIDPEE